MWPENSEWILFPGSAGPSDADADVCAVCHSHLGEVDTVPLWERLGDGLKMLV
jgi:hypothetical protein